MPAPTVLIANATQSVAASTSYVTTETADPTDNAQVLIVAEVHFEGGSSPAVAPEFSAFGQTFTLVKWMPDYGFAGSAFGVWAATGAVLTNTAVTMSRPAGQTYTWDDVRLYVIEATGFSDVALAGFGAFDTGTPVSVALTLTGTAGVIAFAKFDGGGYNNTPRGAPNPVWTELYDLAIPASSGRSGQYLLGADTHATATRDDESTGIAVMIAVELIADEEEEAAVDQSAYRFYEDDGAEGAATPLAAENTPITMSAGDKARIRVQLNATGDPASFNPQLEFRKVGDTTWNRVN